MADQEPKKVCIVTGGSMGIGLACCKLYSKDGYMVYNVDLADSKEEVDNMTTLKCDVSNVPELEKAFKQILEKTGNRVDVLVSNAGIWQKDAILNVTEETFDKFVGINVKGAFFSIKCVTAAMQAQKFGAIVVMCSDQTLIGKEDQPLYGLTKGALGTLVKSTALSMAKYNVTCNGICPGTIDTPLVVYGARDLGIDDLDSFRDALGKAQPIQRLGQADEIAQCVKFAASQSWMTGSLIPIDGGYTCG